MRRGARRCSVAGQHEEAEAAFEQALALDPNSFEANLFYRPPLRRAGASSNARSTCFIRALEVQPDDYQAPFLLDSRSCAALGRKEEAENMRARA